MPETTEQEIRMVVSETTVPQEQDPGMVDSETTVVLNLNLGLTVVSEMKAVSQELRAVSREQMVVSEMKAVSQELRAVLQEAEDSEMKTAYRETKAVHQDLVEVSEMVENPSHKEVKALQEEAIPEVVKEAVDLEAG